jgi:DNA invertase Pin-like site-specific DNA recombinase
MSRNPPSRMTDPEGDKRRALKLAATASHRADLAETSRNNAIRFAADAGASLREIAAATELPHMTVKRILDRQRESTSSD